MIAARVQPWRVRNNGVGRRLVGKLVVLWSGTSSDEESAIVVDNNTQDLEVGGRKYKSNGIQRF